MVSPSQFPSHSLSSDPPNSHPEGKSPKLGAQKSSDIKKTSSPASKSVALDNVQTEKHASGVARQVGAENANNVHSPNSSKSSQVIYFRNNNM